MRNDLESCWGLGHWRFSVDADKNWTTFRIFYQFLNFFQNLQKKAWKSSNLHFFFGKFFCSALAALRRKINFLLDGMKVAVSWWSVVEQPVINTPGEEISFTFISDIHWKYGFIKLTLRSKLQHFRTSQGLNRNVVAFEIIPSSNSVLEDFFQTQLLQMAQRWKPARNHIWWNSLHSTNLKNAFELAWSRLLVGTNRVHVSFGEHLHQTRSVRFKQPFRTLRVFAVLFNHDAFLRVCRWQMHVHFCNCFNSLQLITLHK